MRLLLVNYEYPPLGGGAGNATAHLAEEMTAMGTEVVVLTSAFRGMPRRERRHGVTVIRVPVIRRLMDRCTPAEMLTFVAGAAIPALHLARRWRPDLVIAFFGIPCGPIAWLLKGFHKIPYFVSLRGGDVPGFQPYDLKTYHRLMSRPIRLIWRHAACVVANSRGLASLARDTARMEIRVIPNGGDTSLFQPAVRHAEKDTLTILFVGRLTHQKGVDILIEALYEFNSISGFKVVIVGDGDQRSGLERRVNELGLYDHVHFVGWQDREKLPKWYQESDIFVLPSRDEGMPNVVLEAMASGLPVIATAIAGNKELVKNGETGLLVPKEDPRALAKTLGKLAGDVHLRKRMGTAGRATAVEHYAWKEAAKSYLKLIDLLSIPRSTHVPYGTPATPS